MKQAEEAEEAAEEEEEEGGDTFDMKIIVKNPEKVGEGMGAYIAYSIITKTSMPSFKTPENTVKRRFSDFLGLSQRISEKYMQKGRIVPPPPEKSAVGKCIHVLARKGYVCEMWYAGMTKVKFSKSEENNAVFIERRRAALERLKIGFVIENRHNYW